MKLEAHSLRSKVARRIFAVFLACALIPFAGLILISYHQVGNFFDTKNHGQLRDLAKLFGMEAHERLTLLEASLDVIGSTIRFTGTIPNEKVFKNLAGNHPERWNAMSLIASDGQRKTIFGRMAALPELTVAQKKHLAAGRVIVSILPVTGKGTPTLLMTSFVNQRSMESGVLIGEIKDTYLWGLGDSRLLPSYVEACIQAHGGLTLTCSASALIMLPEILKEQMTHSASGVFEWSEKGRDYLASYWTVPMEYEFAVPGWTVVLTTTRQGAFASMAELQRTFLLGILVCVGLSVLVAIFQIRKRLVPVEKLQEGTRRIARKEFDFRVNVESHDEFTELATSLNAMADQLGRQFHTLSTKADIDRAVLSLLNTEKIVGTILNRLTAVFSCDAASVTLLNRDPKETDLIYLLKRSKPIESKGAIGATRLSPLRPATADDMEDHDIQQGSWRMMTGQENDPIARRVATAQAPQVFSESETRAVASEFVRTNSVRSIMAAPLMVKEDILGVLTFYSERPERFDSQELESLQGLTGQAAIAIYNSQLFERTKQQAVELEKANNAKDEFLGIMSHELRTPLNVILGYAGMLQERVLGEMNGEQARAVVTINKYSNELLAMTESIMEATRIQTGAIVVENSPVSLVDLGDELKSRYDCPPGKSITLSWHFSPELPVLRTDASKLKTILHNLIDNAIKFTGEGSIAVSACYLTEERTVQFKVADTGKGIPQESQSLIFEMFRQLDSSKTRQYGGVGLGLYIVRKLAALIGAEVSVESRPGCGATFTVSIPIGGRNVIAADGSDAPTLASKLIH